MSILVTWGQSLASANDQSTCNLTPKCIDMFSGRDVVEVACGSRHNLFVMRDGTVYAQGDNSLGQLGVTRREDSNMTQPVLVTSLDAQKIRMVACGEDFSIAVNDKGQVYSWGKNSHGQTAQNRPEGVLFTGIKLIPSLNAFRLEGVACGKQHVLAFTEDSCVFAWGCNRFGQLGLGRRDISFVCVPQEVTSLRLLPVRHVSAGGSHSFCLSVSGVLFGWGRNCDGQLGLGSRSDEFAPVQLEQLRNRHVVHVACGEKHSVVRTVHGAVFSFGCAESGQLGHGNQRPLAQPQQIQHLMGSRVTQVACGRSHTLAVVPAEDAVYVFGSGEHGQLGLDHCGDKTSPTSVCRLWPKDRETRPQLHWTAAGGNASFAWGRPCNKLQPPPGQPETEARELPLAVIDFDLVQRLKEGASAARNSDISRLRSVLSAPACLVASCLDEPHFDPRSTASGLNLALAADLTTELVGALSEAEIEGTVLKSLARLLSRLESCTEPLCDVECLRAVLLLPVTAFMGQPRFFQFQARFARYFHELVDRDEKAKRVLTDWLTACPAMFKKVVLAVKEAAAFIYALPCDEVFAFDERQAALHELFKMLDVLNTMNTRKGPTPVVPSETFYLPEIINHIDIKEDLYAWRKSMMEPNKDQFHFCDFLFLFDGSAKSKLLTEFAQIEMKFYMWRSQMTTEEPHPFTLLRVRRSNLVGDTLDALERLTLSDFKKELSIEFVGEIGVDEGGLKKEFFLILFRDILDPKYGMFQLDEQSKILWFHPNSLETDVMFLMIGRLLGLAIYNSILVPLNFPLALFKKLLDCPLNFDDFKELHPTVARSLQHVIDYDGDPNENILDLNFEILEPLLGGGHKSVELIKNGANIAVTMANRDEYVRRYIEHVLNDSCKLQFNALKKGFYQVCGQYLGRLFHPTELRNVVLGSEEYDWESLEMNATYSGVLSRQHCLVQWFWQVFNHEMNDEEKKKLLLFITGSDRVPVVGMSGIRLEISNSIRTDDTYFPVAHTCSCLLEIPLYTSKAVLKRQILSAIQHSEGFGIE